ncbi:MAG: DUF5808 domain-containing protein, partial [Steroidobacteraceae bacterium]
AWPLLVGGLFLQAIPDLMRPGLFFGRTVDPGFRDSEAARAIRRRYSVAVWVVTLIALGLAVAAGLARAGALARLAAHPGLRPVLWLFQIAVAAVSFALANRATRPHALQRQSVVTVELPARPEAPSTIIVATLALPLVSLAVLAAWIASHWHAVPAQVPIHWRFDRIDGWMATSPASVAALLLLDTLVCLLPAALAWGVLYGSRRVTMSGSAADRERRFRTRAVALLIFAEYCAALPAWAELLPLPMKAMRLGEMVFPLVALILTASLVLVGQGGSRGLRRGEAGAVGDRTDDRHWLLGILYFNRADPAFLVEKRFGVGYSFNFAHPLAWTLLAVVVVIALLSRIL